MDLSHHLTSPPVFFAQFRVQLGWRDRNLPLGERPFGAPEWLKTGYVRHAPAVPLTPLLCLPRSYHLCHRVSPPLCVCILCVVSMSSSLIDISSATAGERAIKDASGHWLCVLCPRPTRIYNERRNSRVWGVGRAHHKCIKQHERRGIKRPASVDSADVPRERPPHPLSTPASASSSTATASTAVDSHSTAAAAASLSHMHRFREHGHTIVSSTDQSRDIAWKVLQLSHRSSSVEVIAGEVKQLDLRTLKNTDTLEDEWNALVKRTAAACGVQGDSMFVVDTKILTASPGRGDQPIHFDCARGVAAREQYSCILICSNGCFSTALPRFAENEDLSFSSDRRSMQKVAHLLDESHYDSIPVSAGDIVFFRQSTPHRGVQNTMPQGNRVVLFGMLSPSSEFGQDAQQVFPWLYVGHAFGWESLEFAAALVAGRDHKPIERFKQDYGTDARDSALRCLHQWNLTEQYLKS